MKDPVDRTKVVLRHLPPALSQSSLMDQINTRFTGRYNWVSFRPGKTSHKHQIYSRAYIDFKRPDDVVEFAEFFDGHLFVNEKGAQFKTIVEYAPSQRVPKPWTKKDGREGTIHKDPEYMEFLEFLAKPVENLPSAEIQLERREAERAGAPKEPPIITPLMDFVRQKRAAKTGSQRSSSNGKLSRRALGASPSNSRSASTKRGSDKKRASTSMYVMRDNAKSASSKEKSTYILVPRRDGDQPSDKSSATEVVDDENVRSTDGMILGASGAAGPTKKKVLLLKGKEREIAQAPGGTSQHHSATSPVKTSTASATFKQNQRRETGGKMIRSILLNKEAHLGQSSSGAQADLPVHTSNLEKERRPPRSINMRSVLRDHLSNVSQASSGPDYDSKRVLDEKVNGNDLHANEKQEKRNRNKDRPDRGVWTLRRSDGSHASNESLSSSSSHTTQLLSDAVEGMAISGVSRTRDDFVDTEYNNKSYRGKPRNVDGTVQNSHLGRAGDPLSANDLLSSQSEAKLDMPSTSRSMELKASSGRNSYTSLENGNHRHVARRGLAHAVKDVDGTVGEGKSSKRGGASNYGSHEKQVWVQKSGGS